MPDYYVSGRFLFTKKEEDTNGTYYQITNMYAGKLWDYKHKFYSVEEMDEYARNN